MLKERESVMYERAAVTIGRFSQWSAAPVHVKKEGMDEGRLTFNHHLDFEKPLGNHMKLAARAHGFLSLPNHANTNKSTSRMRIRVC